MKKLLLLLGMAAPLLAQSSYTLSGTVTSGGSPVANARIDVHYGSSQETAVSATTDSNGAFRATVDQKQLNIIVVGPPNSGLQNEGYPFTISADTVARFVLQPSVKVTVAGQWSGGNSEILQLYSLTANRSFFANTPNGSVTFDVPADIYSAHAAHADTSYWFGRAIVDARDGQAKSVTIRSERDAPVTTTLPPKRALIHVSAPDANGMATISGDAGACEPQATVAVVNLHTHETAVLLSGTDGSFSLNMFAPPGTTLQIKHDPSGRYLPNMNFSGGTNDAFEIPPGTYIDVPPPAGQFSVVSMLYPFTNDADLHLRQYAAFGSQDGARIWLTGSMPSTPWSAGQSIALSGTLKVFSRAVATTPLANVKFGGSMNLERLFDADGIERGTQMQFVSSFMTPTALPIERQSFDTFLGPATITNARIVDGRIEADWSASFRVPASLPAGVYRPVFTPAITGLEPSARYFDVLPTPEGEYAGRIGRMPIVRVGTPAAPREFWMLGLDTFSNGARGTVAVEDRGRAGISSHVLTNPRAMVVPMADARSGAPLRYRLEPYVPFVSLTFARLGYTTRIPFRFPSGSLHVKVTRPDGSVDDLGSAPFAQSMCRSATTRSGISISDSTAHVSDYMQLTTLEPRFDYTFTQYGLHRIEMSGSVDDVFGNSYPGGGTYEVWVARPIDIETATMPGTPFENGNVFAPQVVLQPPVPADVSVEIVHMPDSDPAKAQRTTVSGRANRFGFFSPAVPVRLDGAGEYRADITAAYVDPQGVLWMGETTWGNVVETPGSPLVTHGRRGFDGTNTIQQQWFTVRQARTGGDHVMFPFHRGDVMWMQQSDPAADIPKITLQDPAGTFAQRVRTRATNGMSFEGPVLEERIAAGEIPLCSTAPTRELGALIPEKAVQFGYFYGFAEKPGVHIREIISEDLSGNAYWRFHENYHFQLGAGIGGDLQNDIKFQFGGAVWRDPDFRYYGAYGSLFVLLPSNDAAGGRVFPPFQGNGGGPTGGPILTLKGKPVDLFFHPTALRAGTILQLGERAAIAGQIGPTLPAKVNVLITSPSGVLRAIGGQANKIGWFYDPSRDFFVDEPGVWKVKIGVLYDGLTSAGPVQPPYPAGDVLGSRDGEFYFYVVRPDAPSASVAPLPQWQRPSQRTISFSVAPPVALTNPTLTYTTTMPGFILEEGTSSALTYTYDAQKLARDFPNLDLYDGDGLAGVDTITISLLVSGTDANGKPQHYARQVVLQGEELQMPEQKEAASPLRRRAR